MLILIDIYPMDEEERRQTRLVFDWTELSIYWGKGGRLGDDAYRRDDGPYCTVYRLDIPFDDGKWVHYYRVEYGSWV